MGIHIAHIRENGPVLLRLTGMVMPVISNLHGSAVCCEKIPVSCCSQIHRIGGRVSFVRW